MEKGGSSTVAGVEYQAWVAAEFMVDAILDIPISIQLEGKADSDGNLIKVDDIIVNEGEEKKFYNCKMHAPKSANWIFSDLKNQKVLDQLKEQYLLEPNQSIFFITESPCPLMTESFQRSASSTSVKEARARLTNVYLKDWEKVRDYYGFSDKEMFLFTKQVRYERKVVDDIKKNIFSRLRREFLNSQVIAITLKSFALEIAKRGETVSKDQIIQYLKDNGCYPKSILPPDEILKKFKLASSNLINAVSIIGKDIHINRAEVSNLLSWVEDPETVGSAACLIGVMGVGKTVVMKDLYTELTRKSLPCIAIKSDCYTHIKSRQQLQQELELQDDLLECIASVADDKGLCVVLVDQLDALSDSIARDRDAINIFSNIIQSAKTMPNVKVVVSIRKFDLEHDPTLTSIAFEPQIEAHLLSYDKTKEVLATIGVLPDKYTESQIELFRIPLHLKILAEIYDQSIPIDSIQTLQDLYDVLWKKKVGIGNKAKDKFYICNFLSEEMDKNKVLTISSPMLDGYSEARSELQSNGIIIKAGKNTIGFFHQSFFDYCFARSFASNNVSLLEKVLSEHQGLFVRSQVKQTILYLRGADSQRYIRELTGFLESESVRFHIKDLLNSLVGSMNVPIEAEIDYFKKIFNTNMVLRNHFLRNVSAPEWFDILAEEYLAPLLNLPETVNLVRFYLLRIANSRTNEIIVLLDKLPHSDIKIELLSDVFYELSNWTDEALNLYKEYREQMCLSKLDTYRVIRQIYKMRESDAINILFAELDFELEKFSTEFRGKLEDIVTWDFLDLFEKAIKKHPAFVIEAFSRRLKVITELTKWGEEEGFYRDEAFFLYERDESLNVIWKVMSIYADSLCALIQSGNHKLADKVVSTLYPTQSITLNRVLTWIYSELPDLYVEKAYELVSKPEALLTIDGGHNSGYDARSLLKKINSFFSPEQKACVEENILKYEPEWEKKKENTKSRGHSQFLALSSIPEEYLSGLAKKKLQELNRKFGKRKEKTPKPIEVYSTGPPLSDSAYESMSLEQWLRSFYKYDDSTSWDAPREHFSGGGIVEHSRAFKTAIQKRRDLFYDFVLELKDKDVSSQYIARAIEAFVEPEKGGHIKEVEYNYEKIKNLVLYYTNSTNNGIRRSIIKAIETLDKRIPITSDLLEILSNYALNDPEPNSELHTERASSGNCYYGGDAIGYGINTVRGSAAMAITHHGFRTENPEKVFDILERIANDPFESVRACVVVDLHGMLKYDKHRAFHIYQKTLREMNVGIIKNSSKLLFYFMHRGDCCYNTKDITRNALRWLLKWLRTKNIKLLEGSTFCTLTPDSFRSTIQYLGKMALIDSGDVSRSVGRITMIAYINGYEGSKAFLDKVVTKSKDVIIGIADVCMANIADKKSRKKCEQVLIRLLDDSMDEVSDSVAWHFNQSDPKDFLVFYPILEKISLHISKRRDLHYVIKYLANCVFDHPEECIDVMKNLVQHQTDNLAYNLTSDEAVTVVCSAYMKASSSDSKEKAMDILDEMYQKGYYKVKQLISALDR